MNQQDPIEYGKIQKNELNNEILLEEQKEIEAQVELEQKQREQELDDLKSQILEDEEAVKEELELYAGVDNNLKDKRK